MMDKAPSPTLQILAPGAQIGPYTIGELLGLGGSALVYRALDPRLGRHVALKVLPAGNLSPDSRARFLDEAHAAASVNHPNIAVVYEMGESGEGCYIAMEQIEGETLRKHFQAPDADLSQLLVYLLHASRAIAKAHSSGVVHCDLKPDNIMVTRDGLVKVLDFGLAHLIARHFHPGAPQPSSAPSAPKLLVQGTPAYMSPEQAQGCHELDERSDIFSFGCILFEAAARRPPFDGPTPGDVLHKLKAEPAPNLTSVCPHAPASLARIVARCLQKDPNLRYPSIDILERDLNELLDNLAAPRRRPVSRRRWALSLAAAVLISLAGWFSFQRLRAPPPPLSVAVIPLVPASAGQADTFLVDGLAEGLTHALALVPDLKVIARASSWAFRGERIDARKAARALGAGALVLLSVTGSSGQLRITVDLVGADGSQLWGEHFERGRDSLAVLESRLSQAIAERVGAKLSNQGRARLARAATLNPEAYEFLLLGRYHMRLYNPESRLRAAAYYEKALAIDPSFALAHAELAAIYRLLGGSGMESATGSLPKAEASAQRALAIDPELPEAHAVLAEIRRDQWNWSAAAREYRLTLALNPNLASSHWSYAIFLGVRGRHQDAIAQARQALELDPFGIPAIVNAGAVFYNARRFDEAVDTLKRALVVDPEAPSAWHWIGMSRAAQHRYQEALDAYSRAHASTQSSLAARSYYCFSLARSGRREEASRLLDSLRSSKGFAPPSHLAIAYVGLDRHEEALHSLQQALLDKDPLLQYLRVEPHYDAIAHHPGFLRIVQSVGLAE